MWQWVLTSNLISIFAHVPLEHTGGNIRYIGVIVLAVALIHAGELVRALQVNGYTFSIRSLFDAHAIVSKILKSVLQPNFKRAAHFTSAKSTTSGSSFNVEFADEGASFDEKEGIPAFTYADVRVLAQHPYWTTVW